jgi:DnaA initiator-associating protein
MLESIKANFTESIQIKIASIELLPEPSSNAT